MRRAMMSSALLWFAFGALATAPDAAAAEGRIFELSARLKPRAGLDVRGLVVLRAASGGPTEARGMLLDLRLDASPLISRSGPRGHATAVQNVRLAISAKSCDQLPEELGATLVFGSYGVDADDGTAVIDGESPPYNKLRRAKCVAVVGDWNGDGKDDIGATGSALGFWIVDNEVTPADQRFVATYSGDANYLAYATAGSEVPDRLDLVVNKLEPETDHQLALSRKSCAKLEDERDRDLVGLVRFETDGEGTAFTDTVFDDEAGTRSLQRAETLLILQQGGERPNMVACAQLHVSPIDLNLLGLS